MGRIAIYPGSFNPFTEGHQNILEKTEKMFDDVIIAIGVNLSKVPKEIKDTNDKALIDNYMKELVEARVKTLSQQLPSKRVEGYVGFLTDFVRQKQLDWADEAVVVRGLRNGYDYDYEYNQTRHMWDQMPGMNIIMIACDPVFSHVSSSAYRELEAVKPGAGHHLLAIDRPNPMIRR